MKLYLMRHAQSEHNADLCDDLNSNITFNGVEQAKYIHDFLQVGTHELHIHCSPYNRCRQTFNIIKNQLKIKSYNCNIDFREGQNKDSGWCETSSVEIEDDCAGLHVFNKLETRDEFNNRVNNGLQKILEFGEDAMIISHAGVIRRIRKFIDPKYHPADWKVKNAELFVYDNATLLHRISKD